LQAVPGTVMQIASAGFSNNFPVVDAGGALLALFKVEFCYIEGSLQIPGANSVIIFVASAADLELG